MLKLNLVLGTFEGRITNEIVNWSAAYAYNDVLTKSIMVMSNDKKLGLRGKILQHLDKDIEVSKSQLHRKLWRYDRDKIDKELSVLVITGRVTLSEVAHKKRKGATIEVYRSTILH